MTSSLIVISSVAAQTVFPCGGEGRPAGKRAVLHRWDRGGGGTPRILRRVLLFYVRMCVVYLVNIGDLSLCKNVNTENTMALP